MNINQIWPYLQHPLVLVGFALLLFFGTHRALIRSGLIPPLDQRTGGTVVRTLLRYGFIIALAVAALGFGLQFYKAARAPNVDELNRRLAGVDELKAGVDELNRQTAKFLKLLKIDNVADAARVQLTSEEDRKQLEAQITQLKHGMEKAGVSSNPESFYLLGNEYAALGQFEDAKAAFLEATRQDPKYSRAYLGLAIVHQLEANYSLQASNLGMAEKALGAAEGYLKTAQQYDATDPDTSTQLGYIYKDLAQRFQAAGRGEKVKQYLDAAQRLFKMALGATPNDPSAWNGLGNVALLRGDYDGAIENSQKAVQLAPKYLYAHYDLAMSYYLKANEARDPVERSRALKGVIEVGLKAAELQQTQQGGGRLPPEAEQNLTQAVRWATKEADSVVRALGSRNEGSR